VVRVVDFAADVYPIFAGSGCALGMCHDAKMPVEGLDLSTAAKVEAMAGVASSQCTSRALVEPGDPTTSYLVNKLTGSGMCTGSRMPKGGPMLSPTQIDTIRAWIAGL
jgi:hypothetical protein